MSAATPMVPPDVISALAREAVIEFAKRGEELPWPDRGELPPPRTPAPSMPKALIPFGFADWLADESERLGSCLEFTAVPAIIAAGSLLGRELTVRPKALNSWTLTCNLWGKGIARPSGMKTPSANAGLYPLRRLAAEEMERQKKTRAEAKAQVDILSAQRATMLRTAKKGTDRKTLAGDIVEIDERLETERQTAKRRRYIVNDCTVEALQAILSENPRGVFWYRDELTGLYGQMTRDGHENDRAFLLEAYEGGLSGSYESDRIARGNVRAEGPCISIYGTIQPGPVGRLIEGAVAGRSAADGWFQRFQMAVWPDEPGDGRGVDRAPDLKAREIAFRVFRALDVEDRESFFGAQREDEAPPFLRFDRHAQGLFDEWLEEHHAGARAAENAPAYEEFLVKQRKTVPALALIFHAVEIAAGKARPGPITARALDLAIQWGAFLKLHAQKLYAIELRQAETAAHALALRLLRHGVPDGITVADLGERDWSGLGKPALVHSALDVLEPLGWVRREYQSTAGRTRTVVRVHTDFRTVVGPVPVPDGEPV